MNRHQASFTLLAVTILGVGCGGMRLPTSKPGTGGVISTGGTLATGGSGATGGSNTGGSTFASTDTGSKWINRTTGTAAAGLPWADVASDSTGIHLVAVTTVGTLNPDGNIWTSGDGGATWTNRTQGTAASGQYWSSVASDATGAHLVAVTRFTGIRPGGEDVWTSTDAGATWTKRTTVNSTAGYVVGPTVASDSTGVHLVLADGDIWTSDDSGATWTDKTAGTPAAAQSWVDMASDSTAAHLVAITAYGDIWTSFDAGATWSNRTEGTEAAGLDWQGVASDSTGTHLLAISEPGASGGDIWGSADAGATWSNRTKGTPASGNVWVGAASDASGTHMIAASAHARANDIWASSDSGRTWTNQTTGTSASGQEWAGVASDASGIHLVAISRDPAPPSSGQPMSMPCCFGDIWTK